MSRKMTDVFYMTFNNGWFETTAVWTDIGNSVGIFAQIHEESPGAVIVFPDADGHQGHMGIILGNDRVVVHCSQEQRHSSWSCYEDYGYEGVQNKSKHANRLVIGLTDAFACAGAQHRVRRRFEQAVRRRRAPAPRAPGRRARGGRRRACGRAPARPRKDRGGRRRSRPGPGPSRSRGPRAIRGVLPCCFVQFGLALGPRDREGPGPGRLRRRPPRSFRGRAVRARMPCADHRVL